MLYDCDMITHADELKVASPAIRRQAAHEWALDHVVLDSVFAAKETLHLKALLEQNVYADPRYLRLPKYRQVALEAYFRGVVDAVSRVAGVSAPLIAASRPKTAPPKKGKNKTKTTMVPPPLYPSQGKQTPIPGWTTELPPPNVMIHAPTPFPFAADFHGG